MTEFLNSILIFGKAVEKLPEAARAVRIFSEHILKGQSVAEALVKTGEILAAQALIDA